MIEKNTGQNPANSQPEHTDSSFAGYRAAGSHEVRGSIPLCSTTKTAGQTQVWPAFFVSFCRPASPDRHFTDISKAFHAGIRPKSALWYRLSGSSSPHSPVKLQKVSLERKHRYRHSDSNGGGCSRHGDTVYLLVISLQSIPASTCSHARLMASSLFVPVLGTGVPLSGANAHKGGNNGYPSVSQTAARDRRAGMVDVPILGSPVPISIPFPHKRGTGCYLRVVSRRSRLLHTGVSGRFDADW